ncbi:MAG: Spore coat polysaccharide biosynthesis protein predicted glycosyltransferase-like protein [Marmoricola sp.]|nr:Spore coat polysaccharide biosynthesis protein predicted glycosyltransferase-like protein [Marmoricola sp.]
MTAEVLVVFCDVGPRFGIGHLMRCLALAEEFSSRGAQVVVAADAPSVPFALEQVEARGFAHRPAPESVADHLAVLAQSSATHAVIDSYHLPPAVYAALADAVPTLALVDGDPAGRVAHVLVDQNIGAEDDTWPVAEGTTRLAGLDYSLMRTEILDRRPVRPREAESEPPRVFAFFGGTDAFGAGPVLTEAMVATGRPFDLRVVTPQPWARKVEAGPGQRIELISPTGLLADEVVAADLVLSAAGTSSWELLCLGAACAFVCVAENQVRSYERAIDSDLGLPLGMLEDLVAGETAGAVEVLGTALDDAAGRRALRRRGWLRVDGGGRARVADVFRDAGRSGPR